MAGTIGCPSIAFGSNVLAFLASDGITETGPTTEDVECTPDGVTDDTWESGDVINWGEFSGTVIADDTVSVTALVGTTESTVITYPLGTHSTARTMTGPAYMKAAPRNGTKNGKNTYAVAFRWKGKPTEVLAT
tara:strand:+ start:516 stop:914 length:399 start_codon:yes stop_codon:yes gene_type:complete